MQTDCQPKATPLSTQDLPPVTEHSVRRAINAARREQEAAGLTEVVMRPLAVQRMEGALPSGPSEPPYTLPSEEQWAVLEAQEAIRHIAERFGYDRVETWVRNLRSIYAQGVSREGSQR